MTRSEGKMLMLYAERFYAKYRKYADADLIREAKYLYRRYKGAVLVRGVDVTLRYGMLLGVRRACVERGLEVNETEV